MEFLSWMLEGSSRDTSRRLLVVEDDVDICDHVAHLLEGEGFEVDVAFDGEEALAILRAEPTFDLILLDLMLPKTDGWQFRSGSAQRSNLVGYTRRGHVRQHIGQSQGDRRRCVRSKPFEPDALIKAVRQVLERHRSADLARLTSLGRMAAGISHEVNNPLTYIYASLSMARSTLTTARARSKAEPIPLGSELSSIDAAIERALEGVDRVRSIMNGVRLFIRAPDERRGPVDVRDVIEHALAVLGHEVRQKAFVEKHLEDVPIVAGNAGQLAELFMNLVTNALDSIPPGNPQGHCLTVRSTSSHRGEVLVDVEDTGSRIAEDVRSSIFEPFFSTKPPGLGTGLGLSICHGIVRSHGGSIEVETQPGRGTRVRVLLPGILPEAARVPSASVRCHRLLIVDDDEHVGSALGRLLGQEYQTTVVRDAQGALELLKRTRQKPDVILCDFFSRSDDRAGSVRATSSGAPGTERSNDLHDGRRVHRPRAALSGQRVESVFGQTLHRRRFQESRRTSSTTCERRIADEDAGGIDGRRGGAPTKRARSRSQVGAGSKHAHRRRCATHKQPRSWR